MPRMELRTLPSGEYFYFNSVGGGALSGFGTTRLYNTGSNLSITFDSSNAHVDNDGSNVKIYNNHNNNMVYNGGSNVEIYSTGSLRELDNVSGHVTIYASGNGNNWIANNGSNVSINTDAGDDFVWNEGGSYVTINTGNGKDTVNCNSASNVTINSGDGNAFIQNLGSNSSINAGAGNDDIDVSGNNVTVRGGIGDDNVHNYNNPNASYVFEYADGDGHDVVTKNVKIYLLDNALVPYPVIDGNDIVYYIGSGSIRVLDAASVDTNFFINANAPKPEDNPDDDTTTGVADPAIYNLYAEYRDYYNENVPLLIGEIKETVPLNPENTENDFSNVIDAIEDYYNNWVNFPNVLNFTKGLKDIGDLISKGDKLVECMKNTEKYFDIDDYRNNKKLYDYAEKWHLNNLGNDLKGRFFYWQYHTPKPTPENFVSEINGFEKIKNTLASHGTTWEQKKQIIGNVINKVPDDITKNKIGKISNLDKVGVALSAGVVAANIADSWGEITNSIDSNASLVENISNFGNKFKAQNHEKYDNLNTSLIDLGLGIAAVGVGALAGPGIAAGLAVTAGFMALNAVAKTAYYAYQHENVDIGKTFWKNLNPLGGGYASSEDILMNDNKSDTVIGGESGDNLIVSQNSQNVTIIGGIGNDTITNVTNSNVTIYANAGDDLINNYSEAVQIISGSGNDTIKNLDSADVSITSEDGDDFIDNAADGTVIDAGNGNNLVSNIGSNVSVKTGDDSDEVHNFGVRVRIDTGNGNDYVESEGDEVHIITYIGDDSVNSAGSFTTIEFGEGNDVIENIGNSNSIYLDSGEDYIENIGELNLIYGGEGDDVIVSFGIANSIDGGNDTDYIEIIGNSNSINAGNSDDFIDIEGGYNNIIAYADGEGNDTIYGYNESDIIHLISGTVKNTVASGEDLVINFETNNLTLKNAANIHVTHITGNDLIPMLKYGENYNYTGGSRTIQEYSQSEQINLASDFAGIGLDDNNFYVNSSSGTLTIQNARDKVISYGTADGNLIAYSYMASGGGDIDGRNIDKAEIIIGANNQNNQIYAGSGGSSLWGGVGGIDTLNGGDGYDEFFFAIGSGGDAIQNAGDTDLINLLGVTLDQIAAANVSELSVNITLVDGSYLNVAGNSNVGYQVEGKIYACNHSTGEWYEK